jgi:hypothetical protein
MATWLKQLGSGQTVLILDGPLVDSVDATKEEGLTITSGEVLLWKQGGGSMGAKSESSALTHAGFGMYYDTLNDTDTNTLGQLIVGVWESGILVARHDYMVVPANVWDSMFGTDKLQVDTVELNSVAASAANLERSASVIVRGTVTDSGHTPTNSAFKASDITEATDDAFIGRIVIFTSGALLRQAAPITDYTGSTSVYTSLPDAAPGFTEAPASGDTFIIV